MDVSCINRWQQSGKNYGLSQFPASYAEEQNNCIKLLLVIISLPPVSYQPWNVNTQAHPGRRLVK
jgi:hypothetical protein